MLGIASGQGIPSGRDIDSGPDIYQARDIPSGPGARASNNPLAECHAGCESQCKPEQRVANGGRQAKLTLQFRRREGSLDSRLRCCNQVGRHYDDHSEDPYPPAALREKQEQSRSRRDRSHCPPLLAQAQLSGGGAWKLGRQSEPRGRKKYNEPRESIQRPTPGISGPTPEQVQRDQHERVANTHQQVGAKRKQRSLPTILRLPRVLIVVVLNARAASFVMGGRSFSGVFVSLALKNQRSNPDRLDYGKDECGNEACDDRRKECLSYHERLMAGEGGAVARIVRGVVNRRYGCEAHQVNKSQPKNERQRSNDRPILRQGCST